MELLDRVEYDGVELKLEYGDMRNNKGRVFTVFNKGKFASYNYGCGGDLSSLNWKTFAGDNWAKFGPEEWATILSGQPQFADKCKKWSEFGADEWAELLMYQPQFADRCDKWDEFGSDWSAILHNQPQLANKCNAWSEFCAKDWMELLCEQPQFADRCDKWSDFSGSMWTRLLLSQLQFAEKCDKWGEMSAEDWGRVLRKCPQFANKCDKWYTFKVSDWVRLLQGQPQFAEKCDKWDDFDCYDLARLAAAQDVFLPKFLSCEKIAPFAAAIVLAAKPDAGVDLSLLDGEADYDDAGFEHEEDGFVCPWAYLLSRQPQMAAKCKDEEWKSIWSFTDWLGLLSLQPSFAPRCDWSIFEGYWDEFYAPFFVKSEALISLVKANTSIDLFDGALGFHDLVQSLTLVKEFDPGVYEEVGVSRAEQWSEILSRYPEMVSKFEADVWQEDDDDDF